jgi:excisionase family DNA binding protein
MRPTQNPHLIGTAGPAAVLPARVCRVLQVELGAELAALRTRARGVDQEVAFALMAVAAAAAGFVPPEEQKVAPGEEQAALLTQVWLSTGQAGVALGITRRAVGQAITRRHLPAVRVGRNWRVRATDIDDYRTAHAA